MFQVVTCGFPSAPVPEPLAECAAPELAHPTAPGFLEAALDLVQPAEPHTTTLLLHDGAPATEHRLRVLRSLLGRPAVLPVGLPLPPTGLAATAAVLAALAAAALSPGAVLGSLPLIGSRLPVRAATRSVSRLDRTEIGLGRTLASFVPGLSIPLRFAGDTLIVGQSAATAVSSDEPVALVESGDRRLAGTIGSPPEHVATTVQLAAPASLTTGWWGTRRHFEQCVVPLSVASLAAEIDATRWHRCPECGDAMHQFCRFCSAQEVYA